MKLWDPDMKLFLGDEFEFFTKYRDKFFRGNADLNTVQHIFATVKDWKYSPYVEQPCKHTRRNTSLREIENHNSAPPRQDLRPDVPGKDTRSNTILIEI